MNATVHWIEARPERLRLLAWLVVGVFWFGLCRQLSVEWAINDQYSYGWGVPFLGFYLLWQRWKDRPPPDPLRSRAGLAALCALTALTLLPMRVLQEANPDWRLVSWAYGLVIVWLTLGGTAAVGGTRWLRHFWLSIAFILIAVPWPTPLENLVTQTLMRAVAAVTVECATWCGLPAIRSGNLIYLTNGVVGVDEACSGIRSFQSTLMAAIFLGELYRFTALRRGLLVGVGVALAMVLNVLRALLLTWLTGRRGADTSGSWHDPAGYIILVVSFAALWTFGACLARRRPHDSRPKAGGASATVSLNTTGGPVGEPTPSGETPSRAVPAGARGPVGIWLIAIGSWWVMVEAATEMWYSSHEKGLGPGVTWRLAWPEQARGFQYESMDADLQRLLRFSEGKAASWRGVAGQEWLVYWFRWAPGRTAAQSARIHSPEVCLPASGLTLESFLGLKTIRVQELALPVRVYVFRFRGRTWTVFYCFWEDRASKQGQVAEEDLLSRQSRLRAALHGQRHLGQLVLEAAISGATSSATEAFEKFLHDAVLVETEGKGKRGAR